MPVNLSFHNVFKFGDITRHERGCCRMKRCFDVIVWSPISNPNRMRIAQFINVCAFDFCFCSENLRVYDLRSFSFPLISLLILLYQTG